MVFDRTENEPEEWDPEAEFYDPESDGLTIPQVGGENDEQDDDLQNLANAIEPPTVPTAETDVPGDVLQTFWALVLVLNAAVLLVSLGLLLVVFEGSIARGGVLVATGVLLFGLATRRYRRFQRDDRTDTESGDGDGDAPNAESADASPDDAATTSSGDAVQDQAPTRNDNQ
ncbi:DUF7322 domain-containing protein [Natrinema salsiterrestre]|uniref:DUF7322 domain-containing protein n=1 Tax=Natrinema salsiterrestre TaxID=2950540 RepID=A0A9Q4Q2C6_9EURY|nr:hypothetical protein [Natrinema salsiterrestre]MDF9745128.1 hypothetical protein [Natrinema salsiterrestre]